GHRLSVPNSLVMTDKASIGSASPLLSSVYAPPANVPVACCRAATYALSAVTAVLLRARTTFDGDDVSPMTANKSVTAALASSAAFRNRISASFFSAAVFSPSGDLTCSDALAAFFASGAAGDAADEDGAIGAAMPRSTCSSSAKKCTRALWKHVL